MSLFHPRRRIDRYLGFGLSPRAEAPLRRHLAGCADCRAYYDEGVRVLRATRRAAGAPGAGEADRLVRRAVANLDGAAPRFARRAPLFIGAGIAAALSVFAFVLFSAAAPIGRLASFSGQVLVAGELAVLDAEIFPNAVVEVRSGECILELEDGRSALLRAGTKLSVDKGGRVARLEQGRGRFSVTPGQGSFAVDAGRTRVQVTGTIFAVERRSGDETLVAVHHGSVEVAGEKGTVRLTDGQETTVKEGLPSTAAPARRESLAEDWGLSGDDLLKGVEKGVQKGVEGVKKGGSRLMRRLDGIFGK